MAGLFYPLFFGAGRGATHTPSGFVPGCIIFVSGQLPSGGNMVLGLGEAREPLLIELQLPVEDAPPQASPYYRSA